MVGPDFEYRLYEHANPLDKTALDLVLLTIISEQLEGLKLNSIDSLRSQLADHFDGPITFGEFEIPIEPLIESIDPELRLPRIERVRLGEVEWPLLGPLKARFRFFLDGDWELSLPQGPLKAWPDHDSILETKLNQVRLSLAISELNLKNFKIRVERQGKVFGSESEWKFLMNIPVLENGSGLRGILLRLAYAFRIDPSAHEKVPGSGNSFRPVGLALAEAHSEIEVGDIAFGSVSETILDILRLLSPIGNLAYWIAERIFEALTEKLIEDSLASVQIPGFLDFPIRERYGAAFQRPSDEQMNFLYRPGIEIVGDNDNRRTIQFGHLSPDDRPPADPGDFDPGDFDPEIPDTTTPLDQLANYIHVNDIVVDIFDTRIPIPDFDTTRIHAAGIEAAVGHFADPRFRARDRGVLHLLADGISPQSLGTLRWSQVDLQKCRIVVGSPQGRTERPIGPESTRALVQWSEQRTDYVLFRAPGAPSELVFPTRQGRGLGPRGITAIGIAYDRLIDLFDHWPNHWPDQYSSEAPLPATLASLALGYAVNFIVPNLQFGFLHASGGLFASQENLSAADYGSLYPFPPDATSFAVKTDNPATAPRVDFFSGSGKPELEITELPFALTLAGDDEQPLRATASLTLRLEPVFLECPACMQGREPEFLDLLRNLDCLEQSGLIDVTGRIPDLLQCLLHSTPIALGVDADIGAIVSGQVDVSAPGSFPMGSAEELRALVAAVLPTVLGELVPVPVLFDLFHPIAADQRGQQRVSAEDGWFTLLQAIKPFELPRED